MLAAEAKRLRVASALSSRLTLGATMDLHLASGRLVSGTILSVGDEIEVRVGEKTERVKRAELADETFCAGAEPLDRLLWRATHGDPVKALASLPGRDSPHLAGLVQAICLRAIDGPAREVLDGLAKLDLPAWMIEPRRMLEYETAASEFYAKKDYASLLTKFDRSRAAARAAREIYATFRSSFVADDLVSEVEFIAWNLDTADGTVTFEHKLDHYRLKTSSQNNRVWIKKPFDGAKKGYEVRFSFGKGAVFEIAFSATRWIRVTTDAVEVFRVDEGTTKTGGAIRLPASISTADVGIVPIKGLTLVYVDGRLLAALSADDYALDGGMRLGAGGTVDIENIRVMDRK